MFGDSWSGVFCVQFRLYAFFIFGGRKMICKNCGFENEKDAKFCENCGSKVKSKNKLKKTQKILLTILSVMIVIVLAYASRFLFLEIAFNSIKNIKTNQDCFSLYLYDDYIDVNITDGYLKPDILKFVDVEARLYICNEDSTFNERGSEYYDFWELLNIDKSDVYISTENGSYVYEVSDATYKSTSIEISDIDLEDGENYKCYLQLDLNPKEPKNYKCHLIVNTIDRVLETHGYFSVFESNFLYENGEFIKINQ